MGVTRLLLLGPFYSIQTNFLYFFAHDCTCVHLKLYVILSLFYRPLLCEMLDTLLDLTKLELCAFIDRQHKYKKNLLQSYSPSWNDYNHFLNFMCDIEIVYLARNTPFILTETLYQWIFVFLILCICIVLSNEKLHLFWQKHCTNELFLYVASLAFVCYELSLRYQQTRIK